MTAAPPPAVSGVAAPIDGAAPCDGAPVQAIEHLLIRERAGRILFNRRILPPAPPPVETL